MSYTGRPSGSGFLLLMAGAVAAVIGVATGRDRMLLAVILAGCVLVASVFFTDYLTLFHWCAFLLLGTVLARALVVLMGLPGVLNFAHYPVALGFAWAAANRPRSDAYKSELPRRWLIGLVLVTAISAGANLVHPFRVLFFLLIVGEPLLVIWSIRRWGPEPESRRKLIYLTVALVLLQVPIAAMQGLTRGWTDPVQGTLMQHGAGAHVLGGLFALVLFISVFAVRDRWIDPVRGLGLAAISVLVMVAAGAMAVLLTSVLALLVASSFATSVGRSGPSVELRPGGSFVALLFVIPAILLAQTMVPAIFERSREFMDLQRFPEADLISDRRSNLADLTVGSGPGTTASRASILLAPGVYEEGSPLAAVGLPPTEEGLRILRQDLLIIGELAGGSAEKSASTALAILGDLGLAGALATLLLFISIWRDTAFAPSALGGAIRAALLMLLALIFLDNWLEYPEFTVPLALLIGFASADNHQDEATDAAFEYTSSSLAR